MRYILKDGTVIESPSPIEGVAKMLYGLNRAKQCGKNNIVMIPLENGSVAVWSDDISRIESEYTDIEVLNVLGEYSKQRLADGH